LPIGTVTADCGRPFSENRRLDRAHGKRAVQLYGNLPKLPLENVMNPMLAGPAQDYLLAAVLLISGLHGAS
jgi:hypothetical protein